MTNYKLSNYDEVDVHPFIHSGGVLMTFQTIDSLLRKIVFAFIIISSFLSGILCGAFQNNEVRGTLFGKEKALDETYFQYYNMFRQTYQILQDEYVDPSKTDAKTLFSGAIKGMLGSIEDPFTDFLPPDIANDFSSTINASFYGVGIRVEMKNSLLIISSVLPGTPAAKEDLITGDKIIEIDGIKTHAMSAVEAVNKIRGKLGTSVTLTILRPQTLTPFKVVLKRAKIKVNTVDNEIISYQNKKIAYIRITEFGKPTENEFKAALKKVLKEDPVGIILDVRNNPGGLLGSVSKIINMMVDKGLIVYTKGRIKNENIEYRAKNYGTLVKDSTKIIVLANQGSASASEILVGALKDTHRAIIIGKRTFGKGSVQRPFSLSDGSILKYTVAKYYTPAGHSINKIGINPDIEVDMWYDKLSTVQKTSIIQLKSEHMISDFLLEHPFPDNVLIEELHKKIEEVGFLLPQETIINLVKQRQNAILNKIYDIDTDAQLSEALSVLAENQHPSLSKTLVFFNETKSVDELNQMEITSLAAHEEKTKKEEY